MSIGSRSKAVRVDEENPYWMSFSDLMSGLLVVFILAAVALIIQLTEAQVQFEQEMKEKRAELVKQQEEAIRLQKKLQQREQEVAKLKEELRLAQLKIRQDIEQLRYAEQVRREILYGIQETLKKQGIIVEVVDNETVLRIPETTLSFLSNSYEIPDDTETQAAIKQIGQALHQAILKKTDIPTAHETSDFMFS